MTGLFALPEEILVHILCRTTPAGIHICRQVCHFLWNLIDSSAELQCLISLHSQGYVLPYNSHKNITYAETLELLRTHSQNWQYIGYSKPQRHSLNKIVTGLTSTYDFYGGVYARGTTPNTLSRTTRRLELHQLGSVNKGTEYKTWTHQDLGVDTRDFGMEPDFDLLVLAEMTYEKSIAGAAADELNTLQHFTIHLRSLETAAPHPDAARPTIENELRSIGRVAWSFGFQIVGRYLAIMFIIGGHRRDESQTSQLKVWDWTTGREVTHVDIVSGESESFSFITDRLIAIPRQMGSVLADGAAIPGGIGGIDLYAFEDPQSSPTPPPARKIASLQLPGISIEFVSMTRVSCRSDPAPSPSSQSTIWDRRRPRLFELAASNRVLCLQAQSTIVNTDRSFMESQGTLFVPFKNVIDAVGGLGSPGEPMIIPWDGWGVGTSWLDTAGLSTGNECYVFGQRAVMFGEIEEEYHGDEDAPTDSSNLSLVVFDLDPARLAKHKHGGGNLFDPEHVTLAAPMEPDDVLRNAFLGTHGCKANTKFSVQTIGIKQTGNSRLYVMIDDEHVVTVLHDRHDAESQLVVYSL